MRICLLAAASALGLVLGATTAVTADLRVLSLPLSAPLDDIGRQFERATGHRVSIVYAPSAVLRRRIDDGETFDGVITFPRQIDELIAQGKVADGTRTEVGRAGIGVAVRKGAPKPDLGHAQALKSALLNAASIAYASEGPSGVHFERLTQQLGIATEIKPKLRPVKIGLDVTAPVARGEAELGIVSIPFILAADGVDLAGPLPSELQSYVIYSAGTATMASNAAAVKAFIDFLALPESLSLMKANGLDPVSR